MQETKTFWLKYEGAEAKGFHFATRDWSLSVRPGELVEIPAHEVPHLLRDFPGEWSVVEAQPTNDTRKTPVYVPAEKE